MRKLLMMMGAAAVLPLGALAAASTPPTTLVDLTTNGSGASGSVDEYSATYANSSYYNGTKAFDGIGNTDYKSRWLTKTNEMWVVYKFNVATVVDAIRIYLPTDEENFQQTRAPKDWTFEGSNDKSTWDVLDTQTGEDGWSASGIGESRYYSFGNTTAYKYYKFNCTANNGASDCMQVQEIEFYCVGGADSTWIGGGTTDLLSDVANWGGLAMPGSEYAAYVANTGLTPAVVPGGLTVYKSLRVGDGSGKNAKVVQTNGTVRILNGVTIGRSGSTGEYSISGGEFITTNTQTYISAVSGKGTGVLDISGNADVKLLKIRMCASSASAGSTARINVSENGKLSFVNESYMGEILNATGLVYQTGGSVIGSSNLSVGYNGHGEYIMTGGVCKFSNFYIGYNQSSSSGMYRMTGGTCAVDHEMSVGRRGAGTLEISGAGTVVTANTVRVGFTNSGYKGAGTLVVTNGGEIATTKVYAGAGASATNQATVTFNGGKLTATAANDAFLKDFSNIQLEAGGLTIDTQGSALGITNCTFNVTGNGKITVVGGGAVTFTNVKVNMSAKPSGAYVFAETDGTFTGTPALGGIRGSRIGLSADFKRVVVTSKGFIITIL